MSFNTCVIQNINTTEESVLGVILAQNETYIIPHNRRIRASEDSSILTRISDGTLRVGNGTEYFSTVADQINYLRSGISKVTIESASSLPTTSIENTFTVEANFSNQSLNPQTGNFTEIYNYTGAGKFYGAVIKYNSDNIFQKIEIDGTDILDIDCDDLDRIFSGNAGKIAASARLPLSFDSNKNVLVFNPPAPIPYSTSIKLLSKANSNSSSRDVEGYLIYISKG